MELELRQSGRRRRTSSQMGTFDTTNASGISSCRKKPKKHQSLCKGVKIEKKNSGVNGHGDSNTTENVMMDNLSDDGQLDDEETGLTERERGRRRQRSRGNTLLDHRTTHMEPHTSDEGKKQADIQVLRKTLVNGLLIALWYIFSLFISIYNKWMFDSKHLDFHFPLFTTCFHMLVQFILSFMVLSLLPQFRPRRDFISNPYNSIQIMNTETGPPPQQERSWKSLMTLRFYFTHIGPCGVATGMDIGLGNMSLKFISLTFYTMCKSSSLAFILLFAFLFRLEAPSIRLVLIIATMTLGVLMMVAGETTFSPLGFILVITAAFFSGFRWGLTQILLLRNPATSNPFSSIFFLAPVMFVSLLLLAIPIEGIPSLFAGFKILIRNNGVILGPLLLLFPGTIAFCMTASEFALLQRTSVVTLSIAGIFKEVVTITAAGLVFKDRLTPINITGLIVTLAAIISYNFIKINQLRLNTQEELERERNPTDDPNNVDYTSDDENPTQDLDIVDGIEDSDPLLTQELNRTKFK